MFASMDSGIYSHLASQYHAWPSCVDKLPISLSKQGVTNNRSQLISLWSCFVDFLKWILRQILCLQLLCWERMEEIASHAMMSQAWNADYIFNWKRESQCPWGVETNFQCFAWSSVFVCCPAVGWVARGPTLIQAWISNHMRRRMWWNFLSIPKLQWCIRWSLGMVK